MTIITPTDLKQKLILQGIPESKINDDTLEDLIDLKVEELLSLTNIPIKEVSRKQIIKDFKGDLFESNFYPVHTVNSFKINNTELTNDDYVLDETTGIFYLNTNHKGLLVIEYLQRVSEDFLTSVINPLIVDMITYHYSTDNAGTGSVSSIKEMDTSINYDTSNSLGNRIYNRIESLKQNNTFSARIKWL